MQASHLEDTIKSFLAKHSIALEELKQELHELKKTIQSQPVAASSENPPSLNINELSMQIARHLKDPMTKAMLEHEARSFKLFQSQPHPKKIWVYVALTAFGALMINIGSVYWLCRGQQLVLSEEHYHTYRFGKEMQGIWSKLSREEKEKLAKRMD